MSVTFASLHSAFTTFPHLYYGISLPLLTTDNSPVAIVRVNKSPLQVSRRPLFSLPVFSSENGIVIAHKPWTVLQDVSRSLQRPLQCSNRPQGSVQLKFLSTFDHLIITTHYIHVNYLPIISLLSGETCRRPTRQWSDSNDIKHK